MRADGLEYFDIFIDDFFAGVETDYGSLPVDIAEITEPALGGPRPGSTVADAPRDRIGYRVAVPEVYDAGNDITMRIYFHRTGQFFESCFLFQLDARWMAPGGDIQPFGDTHWVLVDTSSVSSGEVARDNGDGVTLIIDIPLDELATDPLTVRDFLAFEMSEYWGDGGVYHLVGVEFMESDAGTALVSGASIHTAPPVDFCLD